MARDLRKLDPFKNTLLLDRDGVERRREDVFPDENKEQVEEVPKKKKIGAQVSDKKIEPEDDLTKSPWT